MIIGNESKEFIVTDGKGIYRTGIQIITSKVTTTVGEAATTEVRNITFNDEDAIPSLSNLQQNYRGSGVFINGDLTVDFPEDIQIPFFKNNYVIASLKNTTLNFRTVL